MSDIETPDMAQRKQQVARLFGRAATTYDRIGPRFFSHFGRRLVEIAEISTGSRVLDVATGRGAVLFPAVECVGPHGRVTGIDLSEAMVQETARELAVRRLSAISSVRLMDAEALEFPDESFDYVLCGFAIFFFPRLYHAMSEFRRVLKHNGRVCVTTWGKAPDGQWDWLDKIIEAYLPPEPEINPGNETPISPQPEFDSPTGLTAILNEAGFHKVQIYQEAADFTYASEEECWSTWWSHGRREILESIEQTKGVEGLEEFKLEVFKYLTKMRQTGGLHESFHVHVGLGTKP